ncbi:MAG: CRISPR-associated protein Cas4 [Actinomycetota bacterium]
MAEPVVAGADAWEFDRMEVPISAIEHFSYCARQCALIHVEQTFEENSFTMRGQRAHQRVHSGEESTLAGSRVLRGIPLWSDRLGLIGKSDAVELRPEGPYPVEYKLGQRRGIHADLQLCAQALCLEEMLGTPVMSGSLFFWGSRRRHEVGFDSGLRQATVETVDQIRSLFKLQALPAAPNDARCRHCSLINACLPSVVASPHRLRGLQGALFSLHGGEGDG